MIVSSFLTHRRLEAHFHRAAWKVCGVVTLGIFAWLALTYVPGVVL